MAEETKPETPAPKIVPQTGEATAAAAASTRAPAAGATASAPATGANPAATPHTTTTPAARPAAAPRPPAAPIPDLAGKTTNVASAGGAAAARTAPAAASKTAAPRRRRHVAAAQPPRLDGPGVGRVLGGVAPRRWPRPADSCSRTCSTSRRSSSRPASRTSTAWAWTSAGKRNSASGSCGRRRTSNSTQRLLRAQRDLHAPGLHAELPVGGEQVQVPVPRQRLPDRPASTSRAPRRGRSSARASCWPTTGRSWSTRAASSSASWDSGSIPRRFSRRDAIDVRGCPDLAGRSRSA